MVNKKPRKAKKFRSQMVSSWLIDTFVPCRIADIGGGKGLLAYLLQQSGWDATVIDPIYQELPTKYKSLDKVRHKIKDQKVLRITAPFEKDMAKDFDFLIGLHTHGSNMKIIEAAKEFNKDFLLLPCCVIDEPVVKMPNINWRESLVEYAMSLGLDVKTHKFGFVGKDIAIYTDRFLHLK